MQIQYLPTPVCLEKGFSGQALHDVPRLSAALPFEPTRIFPPVQASRRRCGGALLTGAGTGASDFRQSLARAAAVSTHTVPSTTSTA
jgi:hypothetical protein